MRAAPCAVASCLGAWLALVVVGAPAAAKLPPISGTLSKPGYTVLALAPSGKAALTRARHGRFRLRPPAARVTLSLRAPNGTYAGPVVVGRKGGYAIVGVTAGARLGRVAIDVRRGFARLRRRLPRRWLDATRLARTRRGVPLGAGNYGFVRSRPIRASAAARPGLSGDRDSDGVPDAVDIAAGGDLVLNNFRRAGQARSARIAAVDLCGTPCQAGVDLGAYLPLTLENTVSANAPGSVQYLDSRLARYGMMKIGFPPGSTTDLDCGGRVYCLPHTQGGSGFVAFGPSSLPRHALFPDCCDPDGDGIGTLNLGAFSLGSPGHPGDFFLGHGATSAQIGTGDTLVERSTVGGAKGECSPNGPTTCWPITIQEIFATVPALISYSDGAGNSGAVSYPVPAPFVGSPPSGEPDEPQDRPNGFPVAPCPPGAPAPCVEGHVVLTLTFWRPERRPIASGTGSGGDACVLESPPCDWVDIGGLLYTVVPPAVQGTSAGPPCPVSAFSTTGSQLTAEGPQVAPDGHPYGDAGLRDSAASGRADPASRLTVSVDVTACFASHGRSWNPGEPQELRLVGTNRYDRAEQRLLFKRG